jgi:hypothetical protein
MDTTWYNIINILETLPRHTRRVEEEFPTVIRLSSVLAEDPQPREQPHGAVVFFGPGPGGDVSGIWPIYLNENGEVIWTWRENPFIHTAFIYVIVEFPL